MTAEPTLRGRSGPHPLLLLEQCQLPLVHSGGTGVHGRQLRRRAPQLCHGVGCHAPLDGAVDPVHGPEHCRGGGRAAGRLRRAPLSWPARGAGATAQNSSVTVCKTAATETLSRERGAVPRRTATSCQAQR